MPNTAKHVRVRWISDRDMEEIVERRARTVLNVSKATFVRNRKSGKYAELDADDCPGIVELALLTPSAEVAQVRAGKKR